MLAMLPFLAIPGLAIWHGVVNHGAAAKVDEHLAFLESTGIPTHMDAIFPGPENSEDEAMSHPALVAEFARGDNDRLSSINRDDHGHRVDGLADHLSWPSQGTGDGMDVRNFFDPVRHETEAEATRELLDVFAPEHQRLKDIAVALARPKAGWRVEREMYDGLEYLSYPDLMSFMRTTRAFREHAIFALAIEDESLAAEFAAAVHHSILHTARPPSTIMHYLISRVTFGEWMGVLHEGIRRGVWSDASLAEFVAMLASMPEDAWLIESLKAELGFNAAMLRQLKHGGSFPGQNPLENWEWEVDEIHDRASQVFSSILVPHGILIEAFVDDAREFHDFALLKNTKPRTHFEKADLDQIQRRRDDLGDIDSFKLQPSMVWTLAIILERYFQHRCSVGLLQTGIALERHRLKHGSHPDLLEALVPEFLNHVPLDPYDGQPLRYRRHANGSPHVWSVGPNGVDEGGIVTRNRDEGDRVWMTSPLEE